MKLGIKKDDTVLVITGDDKGKKGRVIEVDRAKSRVVVEGLNLNSKHTKPNAKNPQGGIVKTPGGIHISNVQLLSDNKPTRIGRKDEKGKAVRYSKKTGKNID
ncbi:MAG: 50S ribosomal protein L24 [Bacteroidetes bacterium]|nr:50S ribosomal protein L24 [Bacteroidota bacterium]MBK8657459.1 50S ribosomal protein L24 [Bacteroidota bacterium]